MAAPLQPPDFWRHLDQRILELQHMVIEDTTPQPMPGSRLIVAEAMKASPEKPLPVIVGGPQTRVANALLTNPGIAPNLLIFNLMVGSFNYNGKDGWSACIVVKKTRYVDYALTCIQLVQIRSIRSACDLQSPMLIN